MASHGPVAALHVSVVRGERAIDVESLSALLQDSIDAFHAGRLADGRAACAALLDEPALPAQVRELTLQNQTYYARPLAELAPELRFFPVRNPAPGSRILALSPCAFGARLLALASLAVPADPLRAHHQIVELSDELRIIGMVALAPPQRSAVRLSQVYPYVGPGGLLLTAVAEDAHGPGSKRAMVAEIMAGAMHNARFSPPLVGPEAFGWAPLSTPLGPRFVTNWEPTEVVSENSNGAGFARSSLHLAPLLASRFTPGSPAVQVASGHLFLINERIIMQNGEEIALARLVLLNSAGQIAAVSPQWHLTGRGKDVVTGLARHGSDVILSATSQTDGALLAVLPVEAAVGLLHEVTIPGRSLQSDEAGAPTSAQRIAGIGL